MELSRLPKLVGKKKKRVGRGYGSGKGGHTVGRGTKGQKVRGKVASGFEGGQLSIVRRLPKRGGFRNLRGRPTVLNLSDLASFRKGETVDPESLKERGLVKNPSAEGIKILGRGEVKALKFKGVKFSASAQEKALKAGGEISG